MKTPQPKTPTFSNIKEVLADATFNKYLTDFVANIKAQRARLDPKVKYKRNWVDRVEAVAPLSPQFFIENMGAIWVQRCLLSAELRGIVTDVCDQAMRVAIAAKLKGDSKPKKEVAKRNKTKIEKSNM